MSATTHPTNGLERYAAYLLRIWTVRSEGRPGGPTCTVGVEIQSVASARCWQFTDLDAALDFLRKHGLEDKL